MKITSLLTFASITTVASAGIATSNLEVALTFDKTVIGIGETATGTIIANWDGFPGTYFSSINVNLIPSGEYVLVSSIQPVLWNNPFIGFSGQAVANGAAINGLEATQTALFPPFNPSRPLPITSFIVTGTQEGLFSYTAEQTGTPGVPYPFSVSGPFFDSDLVPFGTNVFSVQPIRVIPTQGGMFLFAAGMSLLAAKRFRK